MSLRICMHKYLTFASRRPKSEDLIRRTFVSSNELEEAYRNKRVKFKSKKLPEDVNPYGVFACNELDLAEIKVYGFDYDYTLANYKPSLLNLLYDLGREVLLEKYRYPADIGKLEYLPHFSIRGLHYDIEKGLLLKLDSFLQIQIGSVYRGLTPVSKDEILALYKRGSVPIAFVEGDKRSHRVNKKRMVHLADLFSVAEMDLICNVTEYFNQNDIDYHPEILYLDVKNAINASHLAMHRIVAENMEEYLRIDPNLRKYFTMLRDNDKKLFLVTNSPFHFVNAGLEYLMGKDWRDFFDVVIMNANKPKFFAEISRPIRVYDKNSNSRIWEKVTKLEKGIIYYEGNVKQLQDLTGWLGRQVLYIGDQPYTDLADVTLTHGWRTGAIIKELSHEIKTLNLTTYKETINWIQLLTQLIEDYQDCSDPKELDVIQKWVNERNRLRNDAKAVFNKQFGSVFRTYHNPTYFSRRLFRFADIYTSNVTNLIRYSTTHTFYPRRGIMPHEYDSDFV